MSKKKENSRTVAKRDARHCPQETDTEHCKGLVLLRIPRDYDLVLELDSLGSRRKFIAKLETFLNSHKKQYSLSQTNRELMMAKAETKERRQKKLEQVSRSGTLTLVPRRES